MKQNDHSEYRKQMRLSALNLAGELPNFIALLISALTTKTVLVLVDLLDTASNLLRNALVVFISWVLHKDLRFRYNYGVGKIEAMATMLCDFVMILSLLVTLCFAVRDLIVPRAPGDFLLFVVCVKVLNVLGDIYMYYKQYKICKASDSLVFRSALAVAFKNLIFDLTTLTALILMQIFGGAKWVCYLSPVVSIVLGCYLLYNTVQRLIETFGVMLDKSADEDVQIAILQTMTKLYEKYDSVENVRSHVSSGTVIVDLDLGFTPEMTYAEMKEIADTFAQELSSKVPKSEVSLHIPGTVKIPEV